MDNEIKRVGIVVATYKERVALFNYFIKLNAWMRVREQQPISPFHIVTIKYNDFELIVVQSGMGKIKAALATNYIINKYNLNKVYNIGVCGASSEKLPKTVFIDTVIEDDFDISAIGKNVTRYLDLRHGVKQDHKYTLHTADHFTTESYYKGYFDMEGFAVAAACKCYSVDCCLIKSVTDIIGIEEDQAKAYNMNIEEAMEAALDAFINNIK